MNDVFLDYLYLLLEVQQCLVPGLSLLPVNIFDLPSPCEFPNSDIFGKETNFVHRKNRDALFLPKKLLRKKPKWLSLSTLALNINETRALTFWKTENEEN